MIKNKVTAEIVLGFQNNEEEAFSIIYSHYYNQLFYLAYSYFEDQEIAKDIVQSTFMQAHKNRQKLKSPEAFHVWIYKIAYAECRQLVRKKRVRITQLNNDSSIEDFADVDKNSNLSEQFIHEEIMKSINELSPQNRMIATMRFFEELSVQEIAQIMEMREGTVKSRISRIKDELKEDLKQKGVTPKVLYTTTFPAIITSAYIMAAKQVFPVGENFYDLLKTIAVPTQIGILFKFKHFLNPARIVVATTSVCLGLTVYVVLNKPTETKQPKNEVKQIEQETAIQEDCKIIRVEYSTTFTNQPIPIEVITSTKAYDQILINDKDTRFVFQNGTYTIRLLRNGKILDQTTIAIDNIDQTPPELVSTEQENRLYTLYLAGGESGINPSNIQFYVNGTSSTNFTYNDEVEKIEFICGEGTSNLFEVYDYAGNKRNIEINSFLE